MAMIDAREMIRDGNTVWVTDDQLRLADGPSMAELLQLVSSGHDRLVIDFRGAADPASERLREASDLALAAVRRRLEVMVLAGAEVITRLVRAGLCKLVNVRTAR
jgi:hypothetical protein